jgi:hypothetical protein
VFYLLTTRFASFILLQLETRCFQEILQSEIQNLNAHTYRGAGATHNGSMLMPRPGSTKVERAEPYELLHWVSRAEYYGTVPLQLGILESVWYALKE